jgi:hypothetical protein
MQALLGSSAELEEGLLLHVEEMTATPGPASERAASEAPELPEHLAEERALLKRRQKDPNWRLDRGAGYYAKERIRNKRVSLVQTGR